MLYSKGEEDGWDSKGEEDGWVTEEKRMRSRRRFGDGHSVKCTPLKIHGDGAPVTGLGKGWGEPVDISNQAKAKPAAKPPPATTSQSQSAASHVEPADFKPAGHPDYSSILYGLSILDPNSDHPLHQLPGQGHHQPNPVTIDDPEETSEDYDDDPEESEESPGPPEDPWHFLDNIYPSELRAREQAKKDRGENHLNEQQQKNALSCLKMLEANKIQMKKNASELLCVSSSSSSSK